MKKIKIADFTISNKKNLFLIAGPCVIESEKQTLMMAEKINKICQKLEINFVISLVLIKLIDQVLIAIEV